MFVSVSSFGGTDVAGFGMANSCPCLEMLRGGDATEGSDILQLLIGT